MILSVDDDALFGVIFPDGFLFTNEIVDFEEQSPFEFFFKKLDCEFYLLMFPLISYDI